MITMSQLWQGPPKFIYANPSLRDTISYRAVVADKHLYFISNGPVARFGKFPTLSFLCIAYACCMVDTTSFRCFLIITEITLVLFLFFFRYSRNQMAGWLMFYASDQLVSISYFSVRNCRKQSHCTTVQGLLM